MWEASCLTWRALWSGSSCPAAAPGWARAVAAAPAAATSSSGATAPAAARLSSLAPVARASAAHPHQVNSAPA